MITKNILVVAAHSDDEVLGCADTITRHVAEGNDVHVVFMTNGVGSRNADCSAALQREQFAKSAAKVMGIKTINTFEFPDNKMDSVPLLEITQAIETVIEKINPELIYTHHYGDLNIDHRVTHQTVMTACRPRPGFCVKELYAFVLSSTEWQTPGYMSFVPNVFVDITAYMDKKLDAIQVYNMEMREQPHSRSIVNTKNLASLRGATIGVVYAEAFSLIRKII